jgi:hypothetical protein
MAAGPDPSALASSTWERRTVNPSADLRLRRRACRSSAVNSRTNIVGVIRSAYADQRHGTPSDLIPH